MAEVRHKMEPIIENYQAVKHLYMFVIDVGVVVLQIRDWRDLAMQGDNNWEEGGFDWFNYWFLKNATAVYFATH